MNSNRIPSLLAALLITALQAAIFAVDTASPAASHTHHAATAAAGELVAASPAARHEARSGA